MTRATSSSAIAFLIAVLLSPTGCERNAPLEPPTVAKSAAPSVEPPALTAAAAARFAALALECVHREYPNKISHVLNSDRDVHAPHELTPIFYGCYDWHSSVHGHWLLARLAREFPDAPFASQARQALAKSFTARGVQAEVRYMNGEGRRPFERPYGLAWLMQLMAELHAWDDPQVQQWRSTLRPLEEMAAQRLAEWFPKLTFPIRTGEHSQTAFAMGLILDWARTTGNTEMQELIVKRSRYYYLRDDGCRLSFEPGGQDFLSPCIAEADLMRRVLGPVDYATWLTRFLPAIKTGGRVAWLTPAVVSDKSDGKLAHLDGLNLSRAWMLDGIVSGLPPNDGRIAGLRLNSTTHRVAGLAEVGSEHYEGGHWLGSFAVYLVTGRGTL